MWLSIHDPSATAHVTCFFFLPSLSFSLCIICFFDRYYYYISCLSSISWEWSLLWSYSIPFSPFIHFFCLEPQGFGLKDRFDFFYWVFQTSHYREKFLILYKYEFFFNQVNLIVKLQGFYKYEFLFTSYSFFFVWNHKVLV